jgi:hypothetical protein
MPRNKDKGRMPEMREEANRQRQHGLGKQEKSQTGSQVGSQTIERERKEREKEELGS